MRPPLRTGSAGAVGAAPGPRTRSRWSAAIPFDAATRRHDGDEAAILSRLARVFKERSRPLLGRRRSIGSRTRQGSGKPSRFDPLRHQARCATVENDPRALPVGLVVEATRPQVVSRATSPPVEDGAAGGGVFPGVRRVVVPRLPAKSRRLLCHHRRPTSTHAHPARAASGQHAEPGYRGNSMGCAIKKLLAACSPFRIEKMKSFGSRPSPCW